MLLKRFTPGLPNGVTLPSFMLSINKVVMGWSFKGIGTVEAKILLAATVLKVYTAALSLMSFTSFVRAIYRQTALRFANLKVNVLCLATPDALNNEKLLPAGR